MILIDVFQSWLLILRIEDPAQTVVVGLIEEADYKEEASQGKERTEESGLRPTKIIY